MRLHLCLRSTYLSISASGFRYSHMREPCADQPLISYGDAYGHAYLVESNASAHSMVQMGAAEGSLWTSGMQVSSGAASRQSHALGQVMLHAHAAMEDWRVQLSMGVGLLLAFVVTSLYFRTALNVRLLSFSWSVILTIAIASSWVGTSQFAQGALARSSDSLTLLLVWVNGSAWMFLAVPQALHRLWQRSSAITAHSRTSGSSSCSMSADVFGTRHVVVFFLIAFVTNSAYFAALRSMSASLHTAVFSTTSIFTFVLTLLFLKNDPTSTSTHSCRLRAMCIGFSVLGVVFISGVSSGDTDKQHSRSLGERLTGVAFSISAAIGTAVYQVAFKYVFGNRMTPVVVGLFLAHLGAMICVFYGSLLFGGIASGLIDIDLLNVPWKFVLLAAMSGMAFNFLLKFGIISTSPISVNLATQLGIPFNLGVDLLIVRAKIEPIQMIGVVLMLVSFSINSYLDTSDVKSQA